MKPFSWAKEPETPHFWRLLWHFKDAGCCRLCAPFYAIKAIEAPKPPGVEEPACQDDGKCAERARTAWKGRPRKPLQSVAA